MIRPDEISAVVMQMVLAGERSEQIEALEWTAENAPECLQYMGYWPDHGGGWYIWPVFTSQRNELAKPGHASLESEAAVAFETWHPRVPYKKS